MALSVVDGRRIGVGDAVRRRVADAVRVLHADLDLVDAQLVRDPVQVRLHRERDRGDAEAPHRRRRRPVREDDVPVEVEVRDRVRARVVEAVLRQAVRREARYAPESCSVSIFWPRIQPSFVTAVAELHVPRRPRRRAEELLLARPAPLHRRFAFMTSRQVIVSVAVSTLPPKPPPVVPPTSLNLFSGCCRCAATTPSEKYSACVQE